MPSLNRYLFSFAAAVALLGFATPFTSHAAALDPAVARGKKVLYVMTLRAIKDAKAEVPVNPAKVKSRESDDVDDRKTVARLESLGCIVTITDEFSPVDLATGKDLIMISESIDANEVNSKYTKLPIPIICWENDIYDDLRMTGKKLDVDYGTEKEPQTSLKFFNAWHPLSAGVPAGVQAVYAQGARVNWGIPSIGGTVIATLASDPKKAAIVAYEKGASMDGDFVAPARRMQFLLNQSCFQSLNSAGLALFDAATIWALTPPPELAPLDPSLAYGKQVLYVMNLREAALLKADVPADPRRIDRQQKLLERDQDVVKHMEAMGFIVKAVDEHPKGDATKGKNLIVISNSVNAKEIQDKYKRSSLPVVTWSSDLYPDMAMTGPEPGKDFGTTGSLDPKVGVHNRFAVLVSTLHPLAAGLATDVIQNLYDDDAFQTSWGRPGLGAITIATISGYPNRKTVFAYEKGGSMDGDFIAPARRVALFLDSYGYDDIRPEGDKLLDAALLWAVSTP